MEDNKPGKIFAAIPAIMAEIGAVEKLHRNKDQGYMFRSVDDVYAAVQPLMAKHKVFSVPTILEDFSKERQSKSGTHMEHRVLKIQYRFYADDGSYIDAIVYGEGLDTSDKASNKALAVADKYATCQIFKIPTSDAKDPDTETLEAVPKKKPEPIPAPKFTETELFHKCQDGLVLLRDEKAIDVDTFTKDMAELESIKADYDLLSLYYKTVRERYVMAKKAKKSEPVVSKPEYLEKPVLEYPKEIF